MPKTLKELLKKVSKEDLIAYLEQYTEFDKDLYRGLLTRFSRPVDGEVVEMQEDIAQLITSHTYRDFISERNCDEICYGLQEYVQMAHNRIDQKRYMVAYAMGLHLLKTCMVLASEADSSSGCLGETTGEVLELLERCCQMVANYGTTQEKETVFNQGLALAEDKVFDGWGGTNYELLEFLCPLLTIENAPQLETLLERMAPRFEWSAKSDEPLVRLAMKQQLEGEAAAQAYLLSRLDIEAFRTKAYEKAFAQKDYAFAVKLCREVTHKDGQQSYHWNRVWWERLLAVYEATKDVEGQKQWAMENLACGNFTAYELLKNLHQADGTWEDVYPDLLETWAKTLNTSTYMQILKEEQAWSRLLPLVVERADSAILEYGPVLGRYAPEVVHPLMGDKIRSICKTADNRGQYRYVCQLIDTLIDCGGKGEAKKVIVDLRCTYPRRRALQEELGRVEKKV
ncbi:hypothetical protein RFF05_13065 [Bengtsoniella intestinalis]|uniref:hypothetical protein n=1 Tax=Bengtsoniella intestinalis TaxID=3073143 RepID=UPI00391F26A9